MTAPPPVPSLDDRIAAFLQRWATASVAAHHGEYVLAAVRFLDAARHAPTCADETRALCRAFECEHRIADDGQLREHGYGHGV